MGFSLVPNVKPKTNQGTSLSTRKKGRARELQNLKFIVNFKDSVFKRGRSIPNKDHDLERER